MMQANTTQADDCPSGRAPGTVTLEVLQRTVSGTVNDAEILRIPAPTDNCNDPLNWKKWEKNLNFGLTLLYSLIVFGLISAVTPTWAPMNEELGFDYGILNDSYATGSATLCVGGLVFIPFALKYGRRPVYIFSLLLQLACSIWSANIQTPADLFLTQAFNCLLGALAEVLVQMTIADLFFVHQRGFRNNMYVWTMMFGSALAPLASGYITVDQGWRWVWWWVAILLGASCLLFVFLYEETKFLPSINGISSCAVAQPTASWTSADQTTSGDKKSGGWELHPIGSIPVILPPPRKSYVQKLRPWSSSSASLIDMAYHSYQPLLVLTTVPAVLYAALLYGLVTAAFQVTITLVATYMPAPPYNFTAAQIGLMSLPPFIGTTVGAALSAPFSDRIILWLARRNQGVYEPEMRLWLMLVFAPLFPAGIILFGYSLGEGLAWPIVAVGLGIMSLAMAPIGTAALTYITDAYTDIVADAVVGITFVRNALTTAFIFAITPWVAQVQLHNVMLTFGLISVVSLAMSILFIKYGKKMRVWTAERYDRYSSRQMDLRGA